jgi:hypothetical protein
VTYATTSEMLRSLFRANRRRILHTYALTVLENLFNLLYPFATGLAINGLLGGGFSGLALFAGIWLAHAATGVWRQRYDTRTFTRIYRIWPHGSSSDSAAAASRPRRSSRVRP